MVTYCFIEPFVGCSPEYGSEYNLSKKEAEQIAKEKNENSPDTVIYYARNDDGTRIEE